MFDAALRAAVSVEDLADIVRVLVGQAKAGDAIAAKLVIERLAGRAPEAVAEPIDLEIGTIAGAKDLGAFLYAALTAAARGELSPADVGSFASAATSAQLAIDASKFAAEIQEMRDDIKKLADGRGSEPLTFRP